jgi:peroxiredoxin
MRRNWRRLAVGTVVALIVYFSARSKVAKMNALEQDVTMSLIGRPAPDFSLPGLDGKNVQLSTLKGNVVLLDFWATWCGPCRLTLPHVQKLAEDDSLAKKGLRVFGVDNAESKELIQSYLADNQFSFPVLMDASGMMWEKYKLGGMPTAVVIGKDGIVKNAWIGFTDDNNDEIDQTINQAVNMQQ